MAKRKRLTPTEMAALQPGSDAAPETKSMPQHPLGVQPMARRRPPIAQVAGEAAAQAALEQVAGELRAARADGRMVQNLALEAVDETYLVRDRIMANDDELAVLMESLKQRGQQTPVEVVELAGGGYGLISGWRRLTALRRLHALDAQAGFGTVQALLRRPETASDAYLAMVEENEIRVGLSFYERARIVARAAGQGAYRDQGQALKGLFGAVSRAKRSKIGSFLKLYDALDDRLRFPAAISERLGLALVKALAADPGLGAKLRERLRKTVADNPADELALLERVLAGIGQKQAPSTTLETKLASAEPAEPGPAIELRKDRSRVILSGRGVTPGFIAELEVWLAGRV